MDNSYVTLPEQAEMSVLFLKADNDAKFQNCLRQMILPSAGQNLNAVGIARRFNSTLDELMIGTPGNMKTYYYDRLCKIIDVIIKDKEMALQSKTIFEQISS